MTDQDYRAALTRAFHAGWDGYRKMLRGTGPTFTPAHEQMHRTDEAIIGGDGATFQPQGEDDG